MRDFYKDFFGGVKNFNLFIQREKGLLGGYVLAVGLSLDLTILPH